MDSQFVQESQANLPLPPGWAPPAPPVTGPELAMPPLATRRPLTFATWAKASLLGFGICFVLAIGAGILGVTETGLAGLIAWIGGALIACYALDLRYPKAYAAVFGGVFLGLILADLVLVALIVS